MEVLAVTATATKKIKELLGTSGEAQFLRVGVAGGGCSGFQYLLALDKDPRRDDHVQSGPDFEVRVNADAVPLLTGAELDYVDGLQNAGFSFNNPNVVASCGCGKSFRACED